LLRLLLNKHSKLKKKIEKDAGYVDAFLAAALTRVMRALCPSLLLLLLLCCILLLLVDLSQVL